MALGFFYLRYINDCLIYNYNLIIYTRLLRGRGAN